MVPMPLPAVLPKRQHAAFSIGILLLGTLAISPATAQSVEGFYKGKTVTAIVGSGAGGGYDAVMRLLARNITRHIPGEPKIVVQNMPAAFDATMKDAGFLAEADKQRIDVDPMTGAEMDRMFKDAYATPPDVVERTKVLLKRAGAI